MLLNVRKFISVEMIRDGGSFALKFESCDGNQYILFARIRLANRGPAKKDQHGYHQERELVSYDVPVIIDCDPGKRPQDTDKVIYSVLSGPESPVTWGQARQIIGEIGRLAQGLSPMEASWLKQMTAIVEGDGQSLRSTWSRSS